MKSKLFVVFVCAMIAGVFAGCKTVAPPSNSYGRYEIECAGIGTQGSTLVRIWVWGNERDITLETLKRYAVHGVIFKGYAAGGNGCTAQRPMATSPALEQERANYFTPFFETDKLYNRYATEVGGTMDRVRVGNEYKIGSVISVSKDMLRRDLETAGIIRGLSTGF